MKNKLKFNKAPKPKLKFKKSDTKAGKDKFRMKNPLHLFKSKNNTSKETISKKAEIKGGKQKSIKKKLTINMMATCMVPLVVVGAVTLFTSRTLLKNSLQDTTEQTLDAANIGLTNYFTAIGKEVTYLSSVNVMNDGELNKAAIQNTLDTLITSDDTITKSYFQPANDDMMCAQAKGTPNDMDGRRQAWYSMATSTPDKYYVTTPYASSYGTTVLTMSKAVTINGQLIGVIALDLDTDLLTDEIAETKFGQEGFLIITDNIGVILSDPEKERIGRNIDSYYDILDAIISNENGVVSYKDNGKTKTAIYKTNELTGWKMIATMSDVELKDQTKMLCIVVGSIALAVLVICTALATLFARGLSGNIIKIEKLVSKASEGNLKERVKITSKDELNHLADSFNMMQDNLGSLMNNVDDSCKKVYNSSNSLAGMASDTSSAVNQVAIAIDEIARGASDQALTSTECTDLLQDLSKKLEGILDSSVEMGTISNNTKDLSDDGLTMLNSLVDKSKTTLQSANSAGNIVEEVNKSIMQIGKISDAITEITSQTNLLSLNASIEAARAGEYGKGFAVVADEIRKLAEESSNSADEIKKIVKVITEKSGVAVKAMKDTEQVVASQTEAANSTEKVFNNIMEEILVLVNKIDDIKTSIDDINNFKDGVMSKVENVAAVSEETASATQQVSASTEEITATVQEFAQAASDLNKWAQNITDELSKFQI